MTEVLELILRSQHESAQRGALSMWTVYDHPRDYPDCFVARRWESSGGSPEPVATADMIAAHDLKELRDCFFNAGLVVIPRAESDQPQIVEVWM
jgi:hypothetical protein